MNKMQICTIMKYFWILIFFLLVEFVSAQSDTLKLYQIYSTHFSDEEKAEWTAFENNWNYFEYNELKKKLKIKKLNCSSCESLYADVFLKIDTEGKVISAKYCKGKKCGLECSEQEFCAWFEKSLSKQKFKSLKNKQFIARFGSALKC